MAFACSKKIDTYAMLPEPFTLVNIYPFIEYGNGLYDNIEIDYHTIDRWNPPAKKFRENGTKFLYYSELDSNTLIFLTIAPVYGDNLSHNTAAIYLIRPCSTSVECDIFEKEHLITDVFKYEYMRFQREGLLKITKEYADSVSDNIIEKLKTYSDSTGKNIYRGLVYNDRCDYDNSYKIGDKSYYDFVSEGMPPCPRIPSTVINEFDLCNDMLDSLAAIEPILPTRANPIRFDIQNRNITVSGIERPTDIIFFNPLGQMLEKHRISKANPTITSNLPAGKYIVQLKSQNLTTKKIVVVR